MDDITRVQDKAEKARKKYLSILNDNNITTKNRDDIPQDILKAFIACDKALFAMNDYCQYLKNSELYNSLKHKMDIGNRNLRRSYIKSISGQQKVTVEDDTWEHKIICRILTRNIADKKYYNQSATEDINCVLAFKLLKNHFLKNEIDNEFSTNSQIEKNPIFFHKKLDKIVQNVSEEEFSIINGIRNSHSISKASFNRWKDKYKQSGHKTFNSPKPIESDYVEFND